MRQLLQLHKNRGVKLAPRFPVRCARAPTYMRGGSRTSSEKAHPVFLNDLGHSFFTSLDSSVP